MIYWSTVGHISVISVNLAGGSKREQVSDRLFTDSSCGFGGFSRFVVSFVLSFDVQNGIHYLHNPIIHLFYPPHPPKKLHNHCLQVLLGHEDALRDIKNNAYANFWRVKEVYYGICASSELCV